MSLDLPADLRPRGFRLWPVRRLRRRLALASLAAALLLLGLLVAGHATHRDSDPVSYRVWSNGSGLSLLPGITVADSAEEWRDLWRRTGQAPPAFDPAHSTGVGIFLGQRGSPGAGVQIVGAAQRGHRLVVTFEEIEGHDGGRSLSPAAAPWAILVLDKSGLPVSVEERIRH